MIKHLLFNKKGLNKWQAGNVTIRSAREDADDQTKTEDPQYSFLPEGSRLRALIAEFPAQRQLPQMTPKDITQIAFNMFDQMFACNSKEPFDEFYAKRLLLTEDTPQIAADTARCFIDSLKLAQDNFLLADMLLSFLERKVNDSLLRVFINLFGFFRAQPFQGHIQLDSNTDLPSVPVSVAWNLVTTMFTPVIGEGPVKEINDEVKHVAVDERGKDPSVSIIYVLKTVLDKTEDFFKKKCNDALNNFSRVYSRYQRSILQKLPGADTTSPRMDWKTFRDFMKQVRPELTVPEIEDIFIDGTQFSDSIASITADAFDTLCVSRQVYINDIKVPGSGKRLRYVPPDMLNVIESAWKASLRTSIKKAITELSKNDQSQGVVTILRSIDQKVEESLRNQSAGPFCVQLLYEAATIISNEAVSIAASLPIDKCLAIMEKEINVLSTESA